MASWVSATFGFPTLWRILTFSYSKINKMELSYHRGRADWRLSFGFTSRVSILCFRMQESKVLKRKQRFLTIFVIKHTCQTPVDKCDKSIQKQARDCVMCAFHQCSANNKSSQRQLIQSNSNEWNVTTESSSAIDILSKSVSKKILNHLIVSVF